MLPSFFGKGVTIVRPASAQSRGTTVADWQHATSVTVSGCEVQTPTTGEDLDGRHATSLAGTCYLPPGTDVRAGDAIEYGGRRYLVIGEPMLWQSPTGLLSHVQVRITDWEG